MEEYSAQGPQRTETNISVINAGSGTNIAGRDINVVHQRVYNINSTPKQPVVFNKCQTQGK